MTLWLVFVVGSVGSGTLLPGIRSAVHSYVRNLAPAKILSSLQTVLCWEECRTACNSSESAPEHVESVSDGPYAGSREICV